MTPEQARAWRRVLGALHSVINAYEIPMQAPTQSCDHPLDAQLDVSRMGGPPEMLCRACGAMFTRQAT